MPVENNVGMYLKCKIKLKHNYYQRFKLYIKKFLRYILNKQ